MKCADRATGAAVSPKSDQVARVSIASGKAVQLPEPDVRAKLARAELKKLDEAEKKRQAIEAEMFDKKIQLEPFDYQAGGLQGFFARQELRQKLAAMTPDEKASALKKGAYRRALLEAEPEISGIPESQWSLMRQKAIEERFPADTGDLNDASMALEAARQTFKAAKAAATEELKAVGETAAEPQAAAPPDKPWA